MAGKRPGSTCATFGDWIDEGTNCATLTPPPASVGFAGTPLTGGTRTVPGAVLDLRRNIDSALQYIETLPDHAKRQVMYEFFASFFDHYLPKKFLRQYVWGHGGAIVLSEREMIDCNPYINVMNCKVFRDTLDANAAKKTASVSQLALRCPAYALTNGSLGQFTVIMNGTLSYRSANDWEIVGKMNFYDFWNFDLKDPKVSGRSAQGDIKTTFAHYTLPGQGFPITSVDTNFRQRAADPMVTWNGGKPVAVPDKISQLDMQIKSAE